MVRGRPCLPNLLIIGAAKAGTTSLHSYLSMHPEIFMSKRKELSFFDGRRWSLGVDWYKSNFNASYPVNGEASPRYTQYPKQKEAPERIKQLLGAPKMIYIIRDPIDRMLSYYTQNVEQWPDATPPLRFMDKGFMQTEYFLFGKYHYQLARYLELFSRELIHVVIMERLNADPQSVLRGIFQFVGVDENFWTPKFARRLNTGEAKRFVAPWFERFAPPMLAEQIDGPTWMPWPVSNVLRHISRIGGQPIKKPQITQAEDLHLQGLLKHDVAALREFLNDPLPEWRAYA